MSANFDGEIKLGTEVDTSGLNAGVTQVNTALQSLAANAKAAGLSATQAFQGMMSVNKDQVAAVTALKSVYGDAAAAAVTAGDAGEKAGARVESGFNRAMNGIRSTLSPLRTLRMLEFSTLGLVSVGFYIAEWGRIYEAIMKGVDALEGFGALQRQAFDDAVSYANKVRTTWGDLTVAQIRALTATTSPQDERNLKLQLEQQTLRGQITQTKQLHDLLYQIIAMSKETESRGGTLARMGLMGPTSMAAIEPYQKRLEYLEQQFMQVELQSKRTFTSPELRDRFSDITKLQKQFDELSNQLNAETGPAMKKQAELDLQAHDNALKDSDAEGKLNRTFEEQHSRAANAVSAIRDHTAAIEQETAMIEDAELPARRQAELAAERSIDSINKEIRDNRALFASKRETAADLVAVIQAASAEITAIESNRAAKLAEIDAKQAEERKRKADEAAKKIQEDAIRAFEQEARQSEELQRKLASFAGGTARMGARGGTPDKQARADLLEASRQEMEMLKLAQSKNEEQRIIQAYEDRRVAIERRAGEERARLEMEQNQREIGFASDLSNRLMQAYSERYGWQNFFIERANAALHAAYTYAIQELIAHTALKKLMDMQQKSSSASTGGAGAAASVSSIPFVGAFLAPVMGAMVKAMIMSFAQGGIVPETNIALVHRNEMVLPQHISEFVQRAASTSSRSPGGAGGVHLHYSPTVQALDSAGVARVMDRHGSVVYSMLQSKLRGKNIG